MSALQQVLQMLIDTPGGVEAMAEVLSEPNCPVVIKDGHFIEKPMSNNQKIQCVVNQIGRQDVKYKSLEPTPDLNSGGSKDGVNIKTNSKLVSLSKAPIPVKESLTNMNIEERIKDLKPDEVVTFHEIGDVDFPYLKIKKNPKFNNMYILWNENDSGEITNQVNFSSLNNAVYWAEKCNEVVEGGSDKDVILTEDVSSYNGNDVVELYYEDLPVTIYVGGSRTGRYDVGYGNWLPDEGEERDLEISYTYKITKDEALEAIQDLVADSDPDKFEAMTDEEFNQYLESNFDELFAKYELEILDYFQEAASEHAQENADFDDYLWESVPTKDYFDRVYEEVEDVPLKDFWEGTEDKPLDDEEIEPIDTRLELEGIDSDDPEVKVTDYEWKDEDPEDIKPGWEEVASKDVFDSDGFLTNYVWYTDGNKHVFVFGDSDRYRPEDGNFDWEIDIVEGKEAEAYREAQDWFNSYKGFEDEDLDLESADLDDIEGFNDSDDSVMIFDDEAVMDSDSAKQESLTEGVMSDLDVDVQDAGSRPALIDKLERNQAALESELLFLTDVAPREVHAGGSFDSIEEIQEAIKATESSLRKVKAKLSVLKRGN